MPKSLFQQLVEQTCQQAKSNNQNAKPPAAPLDPARKAKIAAALEYAERAPRCQHIKANGVRCKSPAMREQPFCFFHQKFYNAPYDDSFPPLEDANSVQCAILQVLNGLKSKTITLAEARVLLYGLKAASINARRTNFDPPIFDRQVTEYPNGRRPEPAIRGLEEYRNLANIPTPPIPPAAEQQIPRPTRDDKSNGKGNEAQNKVVIPPPAAAIPSPKDEEPAVAFEVVRKPPATTSAGSNGKTSGAAH